MRGSNGDNLRILLVAGFVDLAVPVELDHTKLGALGQSILHHLQPARPPSCLRAVFRVSRGVTVGEMTG